MGEPRKLGKRNALPFRIVPSEISDHRFRREVVHTMTRLESFTVSIVY